jgi:hypothetical protein
MVSQNQSNITPGAGNFGVCGENFFCPLEIRYRGIDECCYQFLKI